MMNYIKQLEHDLETERDHAKFLGLLLKELYGDGWDKLTLFRAILYRESMEKNINNDKNGSVQTTASITFQRNPDFEITSAPEEPMLTSRELYSLIWHARPKSEWGVRETTVDLEAAFGGTADDKVM